jgi:hypothetical protein
VPIELGETPVFVGDEDLVVTGRIAATQTAGDVLTFTVVISPSHGVLTLTTALDAVTGEPILQVATPATEEAEGATSNDEAEAGDAEGAAVDEPSTAGAVEESTPAADAEQTAEPTAEPVDEGEGADAGALPEGSTELDAEAALPAPGDFVYAPDPDFAGEDVFAVSVADSSGFALTVPVTITLAPVNDAPVIDLASAITLSVGEEVSLPVGVRDGDSEAITLTVDALPPGLELLDGLIHGVVSEEAAGSPYYSLFSAEDADGAVTTAAVDWVVLPTEPLEDESPVELTPTEEPPAEVTPTEEPPTEGSPIEEPPAEVTPTEEPPTEGSPIEEPQPPSPLPLPDDLLPPVIPGEAYSIGELPVFAFHNSTPGSGSLEGYAWLTPVSFGACPPTADALAAQPNGQDGSSLLDEGLALEIGNAPMLEYVVNLPAPGDYVVSVCGCAPQLAQADLHSGDADQEAGSGATSAAANNAAIYVGFNGAAVAVDANGAPLPVGGFAEQAGFTWQNRWRDPLAGTSGAVTLTAPEAGPHQVNLWMAADGLIVYSLRVAPLAEADIEAGTAAACGPSLP